MAAKLADRSDEYDQAKAYYLEAAELSIDQDRKKYLAGIFRNLSSLSFRLANEEAAYCYTHQALTSSVGGLKEKEQLVRLQSALGLRKKFKIGNGKISRADRERLTWALKVAYASGETNSIDELLAQIAVLVGKSRLLAVEQFIKSMNREGELSVKEQKELKELQDQLLPDEALSVNAALYWPAKLIMDLQKAY